MEDDIADLIARAKAFRRAEAMTEERRQALARSIWMATFRGVRQSEIARITGYTREHIRRIVHDKMEDMEAEASANGEPNPFPF